MQLSSKQLDVGSIPTESSNGSVAQLAEAHGLRPWKYRFESYDSHNESVTQLAEVAVSKAAYVQVRVLRLSLLHRSITEQCFRLLTETI